MSRMSEISLEIKERIAGGQSPEYIANWLEIPIRWVYDTLESMEEPEPTYDPFNTVNS